MCYLKLRGVMAVEECGEVVNTDLLRGMNQKV